MAAAAVAAVRSNFLCYWLVYIELSTHFASFGAEICYIKTMNVPKGRGRAGPCRKQDYFLRVPTNTLDLFARVTKKKQFIRVPLLSEYKLGFLLLWVYKKATSWERKGKKKNNAKAKFIIFDSGELYFCCCYVIVENFFVWNLSRIKMRFFLFEP